MRPLPCAALLAALAALSAHPAPSFADGDATIEERAGKTSERSSKLRARLDLSHWTAFDPAAEGRFAFSDLRLTADATRLGGMSMGLHVDGRARRGWDEQTADRATVREAYLRLGDEREPWGLNLGRQVVREAAAAEVDGVRLQRRFGSRASASLFGGLMPHPLTGDFDRDFATAGAAYEHLGRSLNHSGGAIVSWYRGELDRAYLTHRSYARLSDTLTLSGFGVVDVLPAGADSNRAVDLTSLIGTVRYRPLRWLDSALSAAHHHTVLPGKWWADWLNERRREIGFVLDGQDPVGTRITSVRWTNNVHLGSSLVTYLRARRDWRHTDDARGYEARAGLKWRRDFVYADASYAYRDYFSATNHLAGIEVGRESMRWGAETSLFVLQSRADDAATTSRAYDVNVTGWLFLGRALGASRRTHFLAQYQGLFEPGSTLHSFFLQVGYRI